MTSTSCSDEIRTIITEIGRAIGSVSDDDILQGRAKGLRDYFGRLDMLAAMEVEPQTADEIAQDRQLVPMLEEISRLRNLYNLRLEIEQARSLLASAKPWETIRQFTFYPNYLKLAAMEQKGAELQQGDHIVFLGSGPLPLSLIMLCSIYGLKGTGIEREREYAALSRSLVERLGLQNEISVLDGDHFSLPLKQRTKLIMIAAMARPKQEIFNLLAKRLPEGSLVSFRLYEKGLRRILDREEPFTLPPEFRLQHRIIPEPPVNNTVVMVRRWTGPARR